MSREQVVIVTGAHLEAERAHRPLAYHLREKLLERLDAPGPDAVVVCSDLWYLNHPHLRAQPTIAVGGPEVNALTASLADRLPSLFAIDGELLIQGDASFDAPIACIWGVDPASTAKAVAIFEERHLAGFLDAAVDA